MAKGKSANPDIFSGLKKMSQTITLENDHTGNIEKAETAPEINENSAINEEEPFAPSPNTEKELSVGNGPRGRGRPRKYTNKVTISVILNEDVYEMIQIAKRAYNDNITTYIRNLILDDYEKNEDYYKSVKQLR